MKITSLQVTDAKTHSGITTRNHLGRIYEQKPQLASTMMTALLQRYYGNSLETMLANVPVKYLETDDDFVWKMLGSSERNIELVEARDLDDTTIVSTDVAVGKNGKEFQLIFSDRLFAPSDVIVGEQNELYPIRIKEEFRDGTNYGYVVEVYGAEAKATGIPGDELVAGKLFSKEFSPVSDTLSVRGGETNFSSPIAFRNSFTHIRKQYTVPGNMLKRKFIANFEFLDPKGQKQSVTTWLQYQALVFEYQFMQEKNRAMYFGQTTIDSKGNASNMDNFSNHAIRAGFGVRQQTETSNTFYYNNFDADYITSVLMALSVNKLAHDERKFIIKTGEYGAWLFHRAIQEEASGWTAFTDDRASAQAVSKLHSNARSWGFQYVKYLAPNGIEVSVDVDPFYDDPIRNKIKAPTTGIFKGGLAESYRMDIFDIGTVDGEPNIQKVMSSADEDVTGYIPGLRDPYSPSGGRVKMMANSIDGFELHKMAVFAIMVKDPSRTATLLPAIS